MLLRCTIYGSRGWGATLFLHCNTDMRCVRGLRGVGPCRRVVRESPALPRHPLLALLLLLAAPAEAKRRAAVPPDPGLACRQAIRVAEREAALPPGVLMAIATVETGRTDRRGAFTPWAWSLRAGGRGEYFDTREDAARRLRALRAAGVSLIDVGCLQVNLHHHAEAFDQPERGLDPLANARYAARFLKRLEVELGSLGAAVAAYHSRTPSRGGAYRARVGAAWPGGAEMAAAMLGPLPLPPPAAPSHLIEVAEAPR